MSDEGKKLGIVGGLLAAVGAAVAHGADDCARAGARAGAVAGDDLARPAVIAPRALGGSGDDFGRGVGRASGVGLADDGVKPSHEAISSIADEASINAVDLLLDESPEPAAPRAFRTNLVDLTRAPVSRAEVLVRATDTLAALTLVLGSARSEAPDRLLTSDGTLAVSELAQHCARRAQRCVMLACEGGGERCSAGARALLTRAIASSRSELALLRALLAERDERGPRELTLHRVHASDGKLRLVHSRS